VDIENIKDPIMRSALEAQINEFGQTPKQLFTTPHPKKISKNLRKTQIQDTFINLGEISNSLTERFEILELEDDLEDIVNSGFWDIEKIKQFTLFSQIKNHRQ
jgi:hypothetical protein